MSYEDRARSYLFKEFYGIIEIMFSFFKKVPEKSARDKLLSDAHENARAAREAIGAENLDRLKAMMEAAQSEPLVPPPLSPAQEAEKILMHMGKEKVADNLLALIREKSS